MAVSVRELAFEYKKLAGMVLEKARKIDRLPPQEIVKVAEAVRHAVIISLMDVKEIEDELRRLAKIYGGCVSCKHSVPLEEDLRLTVRGCKFGLSQNKCNKYERIV